MKTTVCYSVRVKAIREISPKAVVIETYDGSEAIIPKSQIFGVDLDAKNSYWISEWILAKKGIQHSRDNPRLVSLKDAGNTYCSPRFAGLVTYHNPQEIAPVESNEIESLKKYSHEK